MKTQELFELRKAKEITRKRYGVVDPSSPNGWRSVSDGVEYQTTNFLKPGFRELKRNPEIGDILGTIGDWLDEMGATKADIIPAREAAVSSPEYQKLIALGFKDISTPGEKKSGTISLETVMPMKHREGYTVDAKVLRRIHINGNIRTYSSAFKTDENPDPKVPTYHAGRGRTYHPMTVKSHPSLSGQERLTGSMRASMKRLADMYRKPLFKKALDKMQDTARG